MQYKDLTKEQFNALPQNEKAVLVAKDALEQLNAKVLRVASGNHYVNLVHELMTNEHSDFKTCDAREEILKGKVTCDVCARGGLFISTVLFRDEMNLWEADGADFRYTDTTNRVVRLDGTGYMEDIFSKEQQALIESAFEGSEYGRAHTTPEKINDAWEFRRTVRNAYMKTNFAESSDTFMFKAICNNIIENNGTFKP
jgi:hypothetical protein